MKRSSSLATISLALVVLIFAASAPAQTTKPAAPDEQDITVDGPSKIVVNDTGVHVYTATQPAGVTKPNTGHVHIRMSGNNFGGAATGDTGKPIAATDAGQPTDNPFTRISPDGVAILKKRGVDTEAMKSMKAVLITQHYTGAARREIVNDDPKLIVVLGKGFITHGSVTSAGPIFAVDDAHFMGDVKGDSLVWFADDSFPRGETTGSPVICGPKVSLNQVKWKADEVWIGTYGWTPATPTTKK